MTKKYLALVKDNFNPNDKNVIKSLKECNLDIVNYFGDLNILSLIEKETITKNKLIIDISTLPFIEHIELDENMHIPPGEID